MSSGGPSPKPAGDRRAVDADATQETGRSDSTASPLPAKVRAKLAQGASAAKGNPLIQELIDNLNRNAAGGPND